VGGLLVNVGSEEEDEPKPRTKVSDVYMYDIHVASGGG